MGAKHSIAGISLAPFHARSPELISAKTWNLSKSNLGSPVPSRRKKQKKREKEIEVKVHWPRYWLYLATVLITTWFLSERKANNQLDYRLIVSLWCWIFDQKKDITVPVRESTSRYFTRIPTQTSIEVLNKTNRFKSFLYVNFNNAVSLLCLTNTRSVSLFFFF